MGGFILALGIERWGLHRRIALAVIRTIGIEPRRMVLGFMVATAVLSMWISNTATTLMMLPIAMAILASMRDMGASDGVVQPLGVALMLGVAYSASIGGLATLIGTPPNLVLETQLRIVAERFQSAPPELSMGRWMLVFVPLSLVFLLVAWRLLVRGLRSIGSEGESSVRTVLDAAWNELGPMTRPEGRMLAVFAVTALLWIFRRDLPLGFVTIPGWDRYFAPKFLDDAVVAVLMAALSFVLPSGSDAGPREPLMNWTTAVRLPWGILLLFGGGFAIARAFGDSGLSEWIGEVFGRLPTYSPLLLVLATCTLLTLLTELTSNVATANVMLPILGSTAIGAGIDPLLLMLPATISASCAFMLPVATPPNAIVFSSGRVAMRDMVWNGAVLNLVGIVLVTATVYLLGVRVLEISPQGLPTWLEQGRPTNQVDDSHAAMAPLGRLRRLDRDGFIASHAPNASYARRRMTRNATAGSTNRGGLARG
jgi:sodium-dependent dicarboxylate transporter 2/3/5